MPASSPKKHLSRLRHLRAALMLVGLALAVLFGHGLAYGRLGAPAQHAVVERSSTLDGALGRVSRAHSLAHHTRHGAASWRVDDDDDDDDSDDTLAADHGWGDLVASPAVEAFSIPAGVEVGLASVGIVHQASILSAPRTLHEARGPPAPLTTV
ncbi:MAG: hypothetical protein NVS3B10_12720 [Polyangiales bacterium]